MKKIVIVRWILTVALLVCVWLGQMWAIKLAITLSALAVEIMVLYKSPKAKN